MIRQPVARVRFAELARLSPELPRPDEPIGGLMSEASLRPEHDDPIDLIRVETLAESPDRAGERLKGIVDSIALAVSTLQRPERVLDVTPNPTVPILVIRHQDTAGKPSDEVTRGTEARLRIPNLHIRHEVSTEPLQPTSDPLVTQSLTASSGSGEIPESSQRE